MLAINYIRRLLTLQKDAETTHTFCRVVLMRLADVSRLAPLRHRSRQDLFGFLGHFNLQFLRQSRSRSLHISPCRSFAIPLGTHRASGISTHHPPFHFFGAGRVEGNLLVEDFLGFVQ